MRIYPRGAEWRKWDLHVHAPGTKLNDQFGSPPDWERYCRSLEESDVAVIGITDYFSLGGLNWSSQHVDPGGVDGQASWVDDGVDGQGADEVAGEAIASSRRGAVVLA